MSAVLSFENSAVDLRVKWEGGGGGDDWRWLPKITELIK